VPANLLPSVQQTVADPAASVEAPATSTGGRLGTSAALPRGAGNQAIQRFLAANPTALPGLYRSLGNQAIQRLLATAARPTKQFMGPANDEVEPDADQPTNGRAAAGPAAAPVQRQTEEAQDGQESEPEAEAEPRVEVQLFASGGAASPPPSDPRGRGNTAVGVAESPTQPLVSVQRDYAALGTMAKARVDQKAREDYSHKAQEFEFKMAPKIMADDKANAFVDTMLARVKQIVDAWAVATGRKQGETYVREFGWSGGDEYYGAFEMTAANIDKVFTDKSQPMRAKLKVVYNAVRNNNLAKWLKLAAVELDREAKGKKKRAWKIKTATQSVTTRVKVREGNKDVEKTKIVKGRAIKETVKTGFAQKSGLKGWLTKEQVKEFSESYEREKLTEHDKSKRDVFGFDRFSGVQGWTAETRKANAERRGGANQSLRLSEQRTLTVGDVPDMTDGEIDLILKRQGVRAPNAEDRRKFRLDPNAKIMWSQGGEYYDIQLGSDSAKAAQEVNARLEAGISGSTDLMLHAAQNLGMGGDQAAMKGLRLSLAGWMLANRDHSFYEIYKAGESYGVPFEIDKNNPGAEYESASNLSPMEKKDFQDTLPEAKFPGFYLSAAYKDTLADTLPEATKDSLAFKASLKAQGITDELLDKLDEAGLAELARLGEIVAQHPIDAEMRLALKQQQVRRIKLTSPFVYLGNKLGEPDALAILTALLKTHHGGKGLVPDGASALNTLADAGVPRVMLDLLPPEEIQRLETVRQAAQRAGYNQKTGALITTDVDQAILALQVLTPTQRQVVKAVLLQTYHGSGVLNESQKYQANAARFMAGHEEGGGKRLTLDQLNNLQAPTPSGGTQITDDKYWASTDARGKLKSNLSHIVDNYLKKVSSGEKIRIRGLIVAQHQGDKVAFENEFKDVEREEGFAVAVASYASPDFIEQNVLPPDMKSALTGLKGLHDKEVGAIFQYTTALYKPIVNASNSFATTDFATKDLTNVAWGSPLGTLKYTGPMLQALASGLAKLPVYGGKVYRLVMVKDIMTKSLEARTQYAARFKVGTIETANYPMSAAKSLNSEFIKTSYGNADFSVVYEIEGVKSGRDIQFVSDKVKEEEVLFSPGSRLKVVAAYPHNPDNDKDTHIWVKMREA
jgi:hypothetical protein